MTAQTINEINEKIRPSADRIAKALAQSRGTIAYILANNVMADIPDSADTIEGTDTDGRKGVNGADVHVMMTFLASVGQLYTPEVEAAILRIAVNPGV